MKKTYTKLFGLVLLCMGISSCNNDHVLEPIPILSWQNDISLALLDENSNDLLDSTTDSYYPFRDIQVFKENGEIQNLSPIGKGYKDRYYLSFKLNLPEANPGTEPSYVKESITKIKFGNYEVDEIKGLFFFEAYYGVKGYAVHLKKAWFKNKLIFDKEILERGGEHDLLWITMQPNSK